MHPKTILPTLAALATVANAYTLYFYVEPLKATDFRLEPKGSQVDFKICAPNNAFEQGGKGAVNCSLSWNSDQPPACYTKCPGDSGYGQYSVRITPDSYRGADNFTVDVLQSYVYELTNYNYATIPVSAGLQDGSQYVCSRGGQTTICSTQGPGTGFNVTQKQNYGGYYPPNTTLCNAN